MCSFSKIVLVEVQEGPEGLLGYKRPVNQPVRQKLFLIRKLSNTTLRFTMG